MAATNATRAGLAQNISRATDSAKLIGFSDNGLACVWSGGYGFNVYDATQDWHETNYFTSGRLAALSDKNSEKGRQFARERMEAEGFEVVG